LLWLLVDGAVVMQAEGFVRGLPQNGGIILNATQSNLLDGVFDVVGSRLLFLVGSRVVLGSDVLVEDFAIAVLDLGPEVVVVVFFIFVIAVVQGGSFGYGSRGELILRKL